MTMQQIEYFLALSEERSFTKAAARIHISQPTISRQIMLLEEELGYELIRRNTRPVRLTGAGEVLLRGIRAGMHVIDLAKEEAYIVSRGQTMTLNIGFSSGLFLEYLLLPILKELELGYPSLKITYLKEDVPDLIRHLEDGTLDFVFSFDLSELDRPDFSLDRLITVRPLLLMSQDHRLAQKTTLEPGDLEGEKMFFPKYHRIEYVRELETQGYGKVDIEFVDSLDISFFKSLVNGGLAITNPFDHSLRGNMQFATLPMPVFSEQVYIAIIRRKEYHNTLTDLLVSMIRARLSQISI